MKKLIATILVVCNIAGTVSAATVSERFDALEAVLPELEEFCAQLEQYNIPCDYEKLDVEIVKRYIDYGREDISHSKSERAEYTVEILEQLFESTQNDLNSIISGDKSVKSVPKFKSGAIATNGVNFVTNTEGTENEQNIIFLNGMGHFYREMAEEIPNFADIGVNLVHINVSAADLILRPDYFAPDWQAELSGSTKITVSDTRKEGKKGALITGASGGSGRMYQTVSTTAGQSYTFSVWVKTDSVGTAQIRFGSTVLETISSGSNDWTQYTATFTADSATSEIGIYTEGSGKLWADSMQLLNSSGTEKLENGGVELTATNYNGYLISDGELKKQVTDILQSAQDNNVMIMLNIQPHIMPSWLTDDSQVGFVSGARSNQMGFLQYNIGNDGYKKILKAYLQAVATASKGFTSLHSVILSNEGMYKARSSTSTFISGYRSWLEEKYGTASKLSTAWGRTVSKFSNVYFPSDTTAANNVNSVEIMDYDAYNAEVFMDWHEWMSEVLKEINPNIKTHAKFAVGYMLSRSHLGDGVDYERITNSLDYIGYDGGTDLSNLNTDMRLMEDILASMCANKPLINSETHTIPDNEEGVSDYYGPEHSKVTDLELIQGYIHGRTASSLWVWRRGYSGETYTNTIAFRADLIRNVGKTTYDVSANADKIKALQNAEKNVYILWSTVAQRYNDNYINCVKNAYNASLSMGQRVSFVTEKQLADGKLTGNEILILPNATYVLADSHTKLSAFANSGTIIAIGDNLLYDEYKNSKSGASILSKATKLSASASVTDIENALIAACNSKSKHLVYPTTTGGGLVTGLETRFAETADGLYVNIANYTRDDVELKLSSNYYNLQYAEDIFTGEIVDTSDMTLGELETKILFFPNTYKAPDISVQPKDGGVNVTWNKFADNPMCKKVRMAIYVDGELVASENYKNFAYSIDGLTNTSTYDIKVIPGYSNSSYGESVLASVKTTPHASGSGIIVDDRGNGKYSVTNMKNVDSNVTIYATYSNGNRSVLRMLLKAGETSEFELRESAEITVKEK